MNGVSVFGRLWTLSFCLLGCLLGAACSKSGGASGDGSSDATGEAPIVHCLDIDPDPTTVDAAAPPTTDEFGPNAPAAKSVSALGRVNIYEASSASTLERVDVYLRTVLEHSRLTIAIQEAPSRTGPFAKITAIQIDIATCEGWATSGPLAIPMVAGRFYAIGFDPNQIVTAFVNTEADSLPIDGAFGRLIGSKTATSVSVPTITWDKFTDKEYNRQRLVTSPRIDEAAATNGGFSTGLGTDGGPATDAEPDAANASKG
jgi:hypothetical protein